MNWRRSRRASAKPVLLIRPPRSAKITSWRDLSELVDLCERQGKWIFRGEHHDPENPRPLLPTIGRPDGRKGAPYRRLDEIHLLKAFRRRARPLVGHEPVSDLEWLAIAQHHGLPTRLLDWTENLLAAAFFASSAMNTRWGLIYAVRDLRAVSRADELNPFKRTGRPGIYRPPHISPRIPAQSGIFTWHPRPTSLFRPANLHVWVIPPLVCSRIKFVLDSTGINKASLFPDLDGLAEGLRWRHKWDRQPR